MQDELAEDAVEGSEPVDLEGVRRDGLDAGDAFGAQIAVNVVDRDLAAVDRDDVGAA